MYIKEEIRFIYLNWKEDIDHSIPEKNSQELAMEFAHKLTRLRRPSSQNHKQADKSLGNGLQLEAEEEAATATPIYKTIKVSKKSQYMEF